MYFFLMWDKNKFEIYDLLKKLLAEHGNTK